MKYCACVTVIAGSLTTTLTADSGRTLVNEIVVEKPIAEVWHLFTTADGAQQWMAPRLEMDFRVGGEIRSSYHPDSTLRDEHTIVNRILTYLPQRMLAIQNEQAPAGFENADQFQRTWTVMIFEGIDDDRTRVRLAGLNYGEGPEWDELHEYLERANAYLLNILQDLPVQPSSAPPLQTSDAAHPVQHEITVEAPLADVWRAWATDEGAQSFFAVDSNIELRLGGQYELYFMQDAPEGQRGSEGCTILAYEPMRMVSFSWNAPPSFPFARDHHTWVVLEFEPRDDARTLVRLTHLGFEKKKAAHPEHAAEFDNVRAYFDRVWPHVLRKLKASLEQE